MSSSAKGLGAQVLVGNSNKELPPSPKGDAGPQAGGDVAECSRRKGSGEGHKGISLSTSPGRVQYLIPGH